jgi:uncharacterized protein YkwD
MKRCHPGDIMTAVPTRSTVNWFHPRQSSHGALLRCMAMRILIALLIALCAAASVQADAIDVVQTLRAGGCGGILPAVRPLHHDNLLDRAAARWSAGSTLQNAVDQSGYAAQKTQALHVSGADSSLLQQLRHSRCQGLEDPTLADVGVYQRGADRWFILASAYVVPARSQAPVLAARALQLINEARQRGARCGARAFGSAPPVALSETLAGVALGHAADMAQHDYFEHQDLSGRTPADRVRAVGYKETLVGENIAYGPTSADDVVKGWLDSPGHCENIMDPRFTEMGLAYAPGKAPKPGLYWVQLLAAPRG